MKAAIIAAAALVGAASARHENVHEHLHKRQDWTSSSYSVYDPKYTTTKTTTTAWPEWTSPVDPAYTTKTTTTSTVWAEWTSPVDPAYTTTTTTTAWPEWTSPVDPAYTTTTTTTTAWPEWDPKDCTVTETAEWAPETVKVTVTVTSTWASSIPVAPVSTSTSSWGGWSYDPSVCSVTVLTSTGAPVWLPDPTWTSYSTLYVTPVAGAKTTSTTVWPEWTSPVDPAYTTTKTTTTTAWPEWSSPVDPAYTTTKTTTTTAWPEWSSPVDPAYTKTTTKTTTTTGWPEWTSPVDPAYTTTTTTTGWPAWSYTATASPTGHAVIAPVGNQWAITYSLYTASSSCKDQGTVSSEIAIIASKGFTSVRVYSTDCSTLEFVGQACRDNGLKLILGVYISSTGISGAGQQVTDITTWAQWDIVELIVVGNEAVFNGYASASDLAWFISSVKGTVQAAGYTGPVTTTEPLSTWLSSGTTFCSSVDVVAANLYAFFNAQATPDQAGTFIQSEITQLEGVCSGLEVYVMESGWPTAGECNGSACPGTSEQATAISSIQATTGAKIVFFTYENDLWKEPGQFGVEQYWGCADVFPSKW